MKKLSLILLLLTSACYEINGNYCAQPSEYDRSTAQSYYESFGSSRERMSDEKAKKLFGCNFHKTTDYIYSFSTLWGKKFILVRYDNAVTYAEEK